MKLDYYSECDGDRRVELSHANTRLRVVSGERGVVELRVSAYAGEACERVDASIHVCFTCEEWERLLCELGRVCGPDECEPWALERLVDLFDQDEDCGCDDRDDERGVRVTVGEIRKAIKGLSADDVIEVTE